MASGINTHELVEKLVELEKAPIERLRQSETILKSETEALEELRRKTKKLQESLRVLSSFEAAFEQKKVESEPAGFIEGTANKKAEVGHYKLEILSLATSLAFASKNLAKDYTVKGGKIGFNDKTAEFKGGSLYDFRDFLNRQFKDEIVAKVVQIQEKENTLVIEGKKTGREGKLKIEDISGILADLGMYQSQLEEENQDSSHEGAKIKQKTILWEKEKLSGKENSFHISEDKKSLFLKANSTVQLQIPGDELLQWKKISLVAKSATNPNSKKKDETKSTKNTYLEDGPTESLNIAGIELSTYTIGREPEEIKWEEAKTSNGDYGIILVLGEKEEKISLADKKEIYLENKKGLKSIRLFSEVDNVEFQNFVVEKNQNPDNKKTKDIATNEEKGEFPNLLRQAQNARIKMGDVILERSQNQDLKDIIEGVSLNLLKASPGEEIEVRIIANKEKAFEQIKNFVEAYNELITYAQDTSRSAEIKEVGKFQEMKQKQGILVTNASVRSLIQGLKIHTSNAYPSQKDPPLRILADLGITTGDIGAKWDDISRGLLKLNEEKLKEVLENHPLSVKEFFVSDTNADTKPDNGFAYTTEKFLEPYTRLTGGIISTQIKNNQEKLKQIARDIQKVEEHAKAYENKLKQKFGYMEANVAKQKATGKFLSDRLNQNKKEN